MKPGNQDPTKTLLRSRCQHPVVGSEEATRGPRVTSREVGHAGGAEGGRRMGCDPEILSM